MNKTCVKQPFQSTYMDRARRFLVQWSVTAGHRKSGAVRGRILNVSMTGMLFETKASYEIGTLIEVEVSPVAGTFLRAVVRIVREEAQTDGSFFYGAHFMEIPPGDSAILRDLLLTLRREQMAADFGSKPLD